MHTGSHPLGYGPPVPMRQAWGRRLSQQGQDPVAKHPIVGRRLARARRVAQAVQAAFAETSSPLADGGDRGPPRARYFLVLFSLQTGQDDASPFHAPDLGAATLAERNQFVPHFLGTLDFHGMSRHAIDYRIQ